MESPFACDANRNRKPSDLLKESPIITSDRDNNGVGDGAMIAMTEEQMMLLYLTFRKALKITFDTKTKASFCRMKQVFQLRSQPSSSNKNIS